MPINHLFPTLWWACILPISSRWLVQVCSLILLKIFCPALSSGNVLLSTEQVLGPESFLCDRQFLFRTPAARAHCAHCFSDGTCSGQSFLACGWVLAFFPACISFLVQQISVLFFWFCWYEFTMGGWFIQTCIAKSACWDIVIVGTALGQRGGTWSGLWSLLCRLCVLCENIWPLSASVSSFVNWG